MICGVGMQCEMYWGYPAVRCTNQSISMREVTLTSGKKKTIGMCKNCQKKYFGKVAKWRLKDGIAK